MIILKPHINKKTNRPFTTSEYCSKILTIYEKAVNEYNNDTNPNKEFISPIGGVKDKEILQWCEFINSIENPAERERTAINTLTNKSFLQKFNPKGE